MPRKIVFLGSKPIGFHCLANLCARQEELDVEICGLLGRSRKEFGNAHDLNALAEEYNIPVLTSLEDLPECDILYSVQYHELLQQRHINKARHAAVNLHMAPLPEYRGANQFSFALLDQKKEFGATIHLIDTHIDHGHILFQQRFPIPDKCWVGQLYQLTFDASVKLFTDTLADVVTGSYHPTPQQELEARYGTSIHYRHEMATIKQIDLSWDKEKTERHIRATSMPGFEPPYCIIDGQKVYFSLVQKENP